jgi:hypothetical protein
LFADADLSLPALIPYGIQHGKRFTVDHRWPR